MKISKEKARWFLVEYHNLTAERSLSGLGGVLEYFRKVGCIQYDPLNIIGRNTDLVLQSRVMDYKPEMLTQLLYKDRLLVDGWDKMMAVYSREDWPYFHRVRVEKGKEAISILHHRKSEDALIHTDTVMDALAENGPMEPRQIPLGSAVAGSWGHRNLSSATLDYLYHIGKVGVFTKKNVNKVYDLIENLLPDDILSQPDPFESEYDFMKWYVYRRLGSVGMLWSKNGGGWLATLMPDKKTRQQILDEYMADGLVQCVEVEGLQDKFYVRSETARTYGLDCSVIPEVLTESKRPEAIRFIAPLDNLLWERSMLSKIFDFDYTWEVYVPESKRKYGYYVIPVLYGNRFIARFEPEKSKTHIRIKNWWWEQGAPVSLDTNVVELILKEFERFATCFDKSDGVDKSVGAIIKKT